MSIIGNTNNDKPYHFSPEEERISDGIAGPNDTCFLCYKSLTLPFVMWGGAFDLCLHPACALDLFLRLSRDIWELKGENDLSIFLSKNEEEANKQARQKRKGNFAHYTAERPLFGKYAMTVYRPEHERSIPEQRGITGKGTIHLFLKQQSNG